jgi:hypothetical protein
VPRKETPRLAILGAGPVGLEAALYARRLDLPVTLYERGRPGEHWHRWGHVRLFTPFSMNVTPLGRAAVLADSPKHKFPTDTECITGREHVAAYLTPLAACSALKECLRPEIQVIQVGRRGLLREEALGEPRRATAPFRLLLRDGKGHESTAEADLILDCTGTYGNHRWMGDGGIPAAGEIGAAAQIAYGLDDVLGERKAHYSGHTILVVGAGYSAATSVCNLSVLAAENPSTWVVWLARAAGTLPIKRIANDPLKERDRLAVRANTLAARGEGNIEFHAQAVVEAIESRGPDKGFLVTARVAGKPRTWEVDRIIANVGYAPDTGLSRELHVAENTVLCNPEPNFFVLGAKSYGRHGEFLLRSGFEQVRDVFALIQGKTDLDLYTARKR